MQSRENNQWNKSNKNLILSEICKNRFMYFFLEKSIIRLKADLYSQQMLLLGGTERKKYIWIYISVCVCVFMCARTLGDRLLCRVCVWAHHWGLAELLGFLHQSQSCSPECWLNIIFKQRQFFFFSWTSAFYYNSSAQHGSSGDSTG